MCVVPIDPPLSMLLALSMKDISQHVIRKIRVIRGCSWASCDRVAMVEAACWLPHEPLCG